MSVSSVVRTSALTKRFPGGLLAVDGIDLDVREGDLYGFLGPNGAGKTTTIRMLLSLIAPTLAITHTGQEVTVGNVTMVFQLTPGTEAPAEMNFYLPASRAVFMAENANLTMHNLLPARGVVLSVAIGAGLWAVILAAGWLIFR